MDTAPGLGFRHPLDPVDAAFVFQPGVGAFSGNDEVRFLDPAQLGLAVIHQLDFPPPGGGVHTVHPEQAVGKQGAFLSADAAPDLHNDIFFIVGILGQQQDL